MKGLHLVTFLLVIIGGFNWLLVGVFGQDVGQLLFGSQASTWSRLIYVLIGLSAVYELVIHKKNCKLCTPSAM